MRDQALFDKIDLHLIRVLHTVLTERSVSRAAVRLGMHQPAVSAALKRLRDLAGDPLLVRSGASMMPTDAALRMVEPAALILRSAEALFSDARGFDPRTATRTFRVAASDYLDPLFLPQLVARIKAQAPLCPIEILPLSADAHYHAHLAQGDVDVVIGNWPQPPDDLHMGRLFGDEVVCLVNKDHPAVRRGWTEADWLAAHGVDVVYLLTGERIPRGAAALSEAEAALIARYRSGSPALRGYLQELGQAPASGSNAVTIGGDVGQQVNGDQTVTAPMTFNVGGKRK